jgi:hypothetical protein
LFCGHSILADGLFVTQLESQLHELCGLRQTSLSLETQISRVYWQTFPYASEKSDVTKSTKIGVLRI